MIKSAETGGVCYIPVKRDPLDIVQKYKPRADQKFAKVFYINAVIFVLLKVYSGLCEQIYRVLCIHIVARGVREI